LLADSPRPDWLDDPRLTPAERAALEAAQALVDEGAAEWVLDQQLDLPGEDYAR
jgi:hypothetical protein